MVLQVFHWQYFMYFLPHVNSFPCLLLHFHFFNKISLFIKRSVIFPNTGFITIKWVLNSCESFYTVAYSCLLIDVPNFHGKWGFNSAPSYHQRTCELVHYHFPGDCAFWLYTPLLHTSSKFYHRIFYQLNIRSCEDHCTYGSLYSPLWGLILMWYKHWSTCVHGEMQPDCQPVTLSFISKTAL